MKNNKNRYHVFLFLSSFSRGLIQVFSLVMLYRNGFSLRDIFLFLFITYIMGILVCYLCTKISKKILLIIYSIIYGVCFLLFSYIYSYLYFFLLAIIYSFCTYSYSFIRHYYGIYMLGKKNNNSSVVFLIYLGSSIASLCGGILLDRCNYIVTFIIILIISLLSCWPIIFFKNNDDNKYKLKRIKIGRNKYIFSILEQFKVMFIELQPLFIYVYIKKSYFYIGMFQVIMNMASLLVGYLVFQYIEKKHCKYITIGIGVILFIKIYFYHYVSLLIIAFFEGIMIKIYEMYSLDNLYDLDGNDINSYLLKEEYIFLVSKIIIILLFILFSISFKVMLFIFIIGIVISGFFIE